MPACEAKGAMHGRAAAKEYFSAAAIASATAMVMQIWINFCLGFLNVKEARIARANISEAKKRLL